MIYHSTFWQYRDWVLYDGGGGGVSARS